MDEALKGLIYLEKVLGSNTRLMNRRANAFYFLFLGTCLSIEPVGLHDFCLATGLKCSFVRSCKET